MGDLLQAFDLEAKVQSDYDAQYGFQSVAPEYVSDLRALVGKYEEERDRWRTDLSLSDFGRLVRRDEEGAKVEAALAQFTEKHLTTYLDPEIERAEKALEAALVESTPSEVAIGALVASLPRGDDMALLSLWASATPAERDVMIAASERAGRQPIQRDGQWVWAELVPADQVEIHRAARRQDADPATTARLRRLERQRGALRGLIGAVRAAVKG